METPEKEVVLEIEWKIQSRTLFVNRPCPSAFVNARYRLAVKSLATHTYKLCRGVLDGGSNDEMLKHDKNKYQLFCVTKFWV